LMSEGTIICMERLGKLQVLQRMEKLLGADTVEDLCNAGHIPSLAAFLISSHAADIVSMPCDGHVAPRRDPFESFRKIVYGGLGTAADLARLGLGSRPCYRKQTVLREFNSLYGFSFRPEFAGFLSVPEVFEPLSDAGRIVHVPFFRDWQCVAPTPETYLRALLMEIVSERGEATIALPELADRYKAAYGKAWDGNIRSAVQALSWQFDVSWLKQGNSPTVHIAVKPGACPPVPAPSQEHGDILFKFLRRAYADADAGTIAITRDTIKKKDRTVKKKQGGSDAGVAINININEPAAVPNRGGKRAAGGSSERGALAKQPRTGSVVGSGVRGSSRTEALGVMRCVSTGDRSSVQAASPRRQTAQTPRTAVRSARKRVRSLPPSNRQNGVTLDARCAAAGARGGAPMNKQARTANWLGQSCPANTQRRAGDAAPASGAAARHGPFGGSAPTVFTCPPQNGRTNAGTAKQGAGAIRGSAAIGPPRFRSPPAVRRGYGQHPGGPTSPRALRGSYGQHSGGLRSPTASRADHGLPSRGKERSSERAPLRGLHGGYHHPDGVVERPLDRSLPRGLQAGYGHPGGGVERPLERMPPQEVHAGYGYPGGGAERPSERALPQGGLRGSSSGRGDMDYRRADERNHARRPSCPSDRFAAPRPYERIPASPGKAATDRSGGEGHIPHVRPAQASERAPHGSEGHQAHMRAVHAPPDVVPRYTGGQEYAMRAEAQPRRVPANVDYASWPRDTGRGYPEPSHAQSADCRPYYDAVAEQGPANRVVDDGHIMPNTPPAHAVSAQIPVITPVPVVMQPPSTLNHHHQGNQPPSLASGQSQSMARGQPQGYGTMQSLVYPAGPQVPLHVADSAPVATQPASTDVYIDPQVVLGYEGTQRHAPQQPQAYSATHMRQGEVVYIAPGAQSGSAGVATAAASTQQLYQQQVHFSPHPSCPKMHSVLGTGGVHHLASTTRSLCDSLRCVLCLLFLLHLPFSHRSLSHEAPQVCNQMHR
jgi:hypothetical protein